MSITALTNFIGSTIKGGPDKEGWGGKAGQRLICEKSATVATAARGVAGVAAAHGSSLETE